LSRELERERDIKWQSDDMGSACCSENGILHVLNLCGYACFYY